MSRYLRIAAMGLSGAASNPLRAALTTLGVVIGVAAVIVLTSLGNGVQQSVSGEIQGLGTDLVQVSPGTGGAGSPFGAAPASTLTPQDARLVEDLPSIERASPSVSAVAPAGSPAGGTPGPPGGGQPGGASETAPPTGQGQPGGGQSFTGVDPSYNEISSVELSAGRFVEDEGETVLAAEAARELLDASPREAVGQNVEIGGGEYGVVGVAESASSGGEDFGPPTPETSYLITSDALQLSETENVGQIVAQAENSEAVGPAEDRIRSELTEAHGGTEDFSVITQEELLSAFTQVTDQLNGFLAGIAGISLLVGGIGIMNIMLVSVAERTREIGVRKALGATDGDISLQFLCEAVLLALMGGLLGIALGLVGAWILPEVIVDLPPAVVEGVRLAKLAQEAN